MIVIHDTRILLMPFEFAPVNLITTSVPCPLYASMVILEDPENGYSP